MKGQLKEKTFTEGKENALEERDMEERRYNPSHETSDYDWMRYINLK